MLFLGLLGLVFSLVGLCGLEVLLRDKDWGHQVLLGQRQTALVCKLLLGCGGRVGSGQMGCRVLAQLLAELFVLTLIIHLKLDLGHHFRRCMSDELLFVDLKRLALRKRKQHISTHLLFLVLKQLGLITAQFLHIPIKVVGNLSLNASQLLNFKDFGLFEECLVLTEDRLHSSFQYVGLFLWFFVGSLGRSTDKLILLFNLLFLDFCLHLTDHAPQLVAEPDFEDLLNLVGRVV